MLIKQLESDSELSNYLKDNCCENNICLDIDPNIKKSELLIIKVDEFYNSNVINPDCSPDCLLILKCKDNSFKIFIVELRNISSSSGFKVRDIVEKFITCLDDFMSIRFGKYFHNYEINIDELKLLFISDPYNQTGKEIDLKKIRGTKIDALLSIRIPKFFGKHLYIEHKLPNPTIKKC